MKSTRSRHQDSDFLSERILDEPKPEVSIAYADRGVLKLVGFLRANSVGDRPISEHDTVLILNLLARQLPDKALSLVESGTLISVIGYLSHPAQACRYETARILKGCMHLSASVECLLASDALGTIFTLLGSAQESVSTRLELARACLIACMHPSVQRSLSQPEFLPHLSLLLKSVAITPAALDSIAALAATACADAILQLRGEANIASCLSSDIEAQRFQALSSLRALAAVSEDSKAAVLQTGCMPHVLACLSDSSSRVRCAAVGTLSLLALLLAGTRAAVSAAPESVWALVKLTHDGSPVTAATASRAIRTMVNTKDGRAAFLKALLMDPRTLTAVMEHRAAPDLVDLLRQESVETARRLASMSCLCHLAEYSADCLESIANSNGIVSTLRGFLQEPTSPFYQDAVKVATLLARAYPDMAKAWPHLA